jgi:GTP-binding protein Era
LDELEASIMDLLPEGDLIYPADQITDRPERFLVGEIIREKLMRRLGAELPYELTVEIERYEELENISKIYAIIWIERMSQKSIIIGTEGDMLKKIGTDARLDIERLIGQKVYLQLWVKVKKGWSDNERALQSLGYQD